MVDPAATPSSPTPASGSYRRLSYRPNIVGLAPGNTQLFQAPSISDVAGDHLTIMRVTGPFPIFCRLGPDENPWLRIHSRMTIARDFRRVSFTHGNALDFDIYAGAQNGIEASVVAYASYGPLVEQFPPRTYGLKRSPVMAYGLPVTATLKDILAILTTAEGVGTSAQFLQLTPGLEGATLLLTNTGSAPIYLTPIVTLGWGGGSGGFGYGPIAPGDSISLVLDDLPFVFPTSRDGLGLGVMTLSGTSTFSMILSTCESEDASFYQAVNRIPNLE